MRFAGAILLSHAAAVTASYSHYVRLVLDRRVQDAGVDLGSLCRTHQDMGREAVVHVLKPLLPLAARTKLVNSLASECSIQGFWKSQRRWASCPGSQDGRRQPHSTRISQRALLEKRVRFAVRQSY